MKPSATDVKSTINAEIYYRCQGEGRQPHLLLPLLNLVARVTKISCGVYRGFWFSCHNYAFCIAPRVSLCPQKHADSGSAGHDQPVAPVQIMIDECSNFRQPDIRDIVSNVC